ncbi:hypothetical protein [Sphingomonas crocodyli]|uniref:Uncharacterized protein n=1 Tax=Sphingomonas crocodyli TaxID=1979270 RepID=A0A437M5W7_9SPHN|nr:hypothetical protein [Sphingomonas crocodyli]RVT93130.1 hypothetical protein EOD43_04330 [Sphingomonas crocodyli]
MQIDPSATSHPALPFEYDVCVDRLPDIVTRETESAVRSGAIPTFVSTDGKTWVSYVDLFINMGQGRRLRDPASAFFVSPEAMRRISYSSDQIDAAGPDLSERNKVTLAGAKRIAATLAQLRKDLPPWPYDLRVPWSEDFDFPLAAFIKAGQLDAYPSGRCWWVRSVEATKLLPIGESFDDPASPWFVGPHGRADHAEVVRLSAAHRRHWPEIYGPALTPRVR